MSTKGFRARSNSEHPVYATEQDAFTRQRQLQAVGICTGVRKCSGGWELLHNPSGSIVSIRAENKGSRNVTW